MASLENLIRESGLYIVPSRFGHRPIIRRGEMLGGSDRDVFDSKKIPDFAQCRFVLIEQIILKQNQGLFAWESIP